MLNPVPRVLPTTDELSGFFWTSGADGRLRFLRCAACSYLIHPPAPICPQCHARDAAPAVVSGRATVHSFTINHQPWDGVGDVYVIAVVQIEEQPDVRLTTNVVGIDPSQVRIAMPVEVLFEDHDPVFLPLFRPVTS
ncbi:MAG TPA: OB-fold domain-containing protein [Frankiaceae bacterium]|nr:OB-fold domain-containing protein [Frankiaceae bacterium]